MFENLSDRLQESFRHLRGQARLTEGNIAETLGEIRTALLEADVNHEIAGSFVREIKEDCLGADVLRGVSPGQQLVKIVHDRLVALMGDEAVPLDLSKNPSVIMMTGLHGSGKTTTCAKLAYSLKRQGRRCILVAGDIYRPAAIDQLEILGKEIDVPVLSDRGASRVSDLAARAVSEAKAQGIKVVIVDTAGRLQIDNGMVMELVDIKRAVDPAEIFLVSDAALGQEAVSVAGSFHEALGITGVILTKMDGDARGGAALSIRKATGAPIKFIGQGEKIQDLDVFHPERIASRILGMGDIVSLVEKASEDYDEEQAEKMAEKLRKSSFDLEDFLEQLKLLKGMGGMGEILKMLPGGGMLSKMPQADERGMVSMEAMILSMTPEERKNPDILDFSRRKRVARGSGVSAEQVGALIKNFCLMRKMMKKRGMLSRMAGSLFGGGLGMPGIGAGLPGMGAGMGLPPMGMGATMPSFGGGSNYTPGKKKRKKKRR
ncbi:MAG: signal recognition particle protein [Victivallales bacterium]|nr:signal recognition particle protein [Victivallales bacterium]